MRTLTRRVDDRNARAVGGRKGRRYGGRIAIIDAQITLETI
jgi:hypothetical protein